MPTDLTKLTYIVWEEDYQGSWKPHWFDNQEDVVYFVENAHKKVVVTEQLECSFFREV